MKYQYRIYDQSRLLKAVSISRVCLPQACMHQKSTSDIARTREKTFDQYNDQKARSSDALPICHRLCNRLPLSLKSFKILTF